MYKRKTDPELMSYTVCYSQMEEMLELLFFKSSTSFMSVDLESWLLESQLSMESVWLKWNATFPSRKVLPLESGTQKNL